MYTKQEKWRDVFLLAETVAGIAMLTWLGMIIVGG